jgi:protein-S-isoprenylcysteine O-methyltransferase Ste14
VLIAAGFILLYRSWQVLFAAQRERRLATSGPYARVRHPQYIGFLTIMAGFLLQWPALLTLLMFPILVIVPGRGGSCRRAHDSHAGDNCDGHVPHPVRAAPDSPGFPDRC